MHDTARDRRDGGEAESFVLEHITVEYDGSKHACTIYPRDCPDGTLTTTWITAEEGSYVSRDAIR